MQEFRVPEEGYPLGRGSWHWSGLDWASLMILSCLGIREAMQKYKKAAKLESEDMSWLLAGGGIVGKSLIFYKLEIPYL